MIDLLPDAVALALICFAESVAAARALAAKHHYEVDADQELIALGVANLGAGLLQGFAVDASLSRSAVADDSGMKSQLSSIVLFGFLIVTMLFLMPLFHDLPEAVLGAIVIAAVAHLSTSERCAACGGRTRPTSSSPSCASPGSSCSGSSRAWRSRSSSRCWRSCIAPTAPASPFSAGCPGRSTTSGCATAASRTTPTPQTFPGLVILRIDGELFFANARWFRDTARALVLDQDPPVRELLVHVGAVPHLDTTAATMLKELIGELRDAGIELAFARATTGLLHDMERNGIVELVGLDRFFDTVAAGVDEFLHRPGPRSAGSSGGDRLSSALRCRAAGPDGVRLPPAGALDVVHALVGARQQFVDLRELRVVGHHGAEADGESVVGAELLALGAQGVLQPQLDRLAVQQLVAVAAEQGHRRELVAAEPRHHVTLAEGGAQDVGDGHEQLVAFRVALLVVDALQAVHVEVHQQHLPVAALGAAPDLVDLA